MDCTTVANPLGDEGREYLSKKSVANLCDVSTRTIDRWSNDPMLDFPAPVCYPKGHPRWLIEEIKEWLLLQQTPQEPPRKQG